MEQDNEELKIIILPTYEKINAEYEEKISKVLWGYGNFKEKITKQGEEWHKTVDIVVRKHLKKAEETETKDVAILRRDQSKIQKVQKSAQDVFQANTISLQSNDTNKVINYKSRINEFKKVPAKTELSLPSFSPGKISEELIGQMFGEIKPSIKKEIPSYNIKNYSDVSPSPVKQFTDQPNSAEIDSGFNDPHRICCVNDTEQLYITGNNSSTINHLDNKGKLLNKIRTKSGNKGNINLSVMRDGDGRLVYSDYYGRSVNIVNNDKIDAVIRLEGWKPCGVCCTSTNDLLVTMRSDDLSNSKVVRYTGSTVKQEIQFDDQGKALYSDPEFIVENRNLDICVTDWRLIRGGVVVVIGVVVVVDKAGKLKFTYDGNHKMSKSGLFNPWGLATDSQCHILVTDFNNDCVHILNHDGSFIKYIDNCNLDCPGDLSISSDDVLYVVDNAKNVKVIRYLQ